MTGSECHRIDGASRSFGLSAFCSDEAAIVGVHLRDPQHFPYLLGPDSSVRVGESRHRYLTQAVLVKHYSKRVSTAGRVSFQNQPFSDTCVRTWDERKLAEVTLPPQSLSGHGFVLRAPRLARQMSPARCVSASTCCRSTLSSHALEWEEVAEPPSPLVRCDALVDRVSIVRLEERLLGIAWDVRDEELFPRPIYSLDSRAAQRVIIF